MGALGRVPAFTIGGLITSKTGNPTIIFYASGSVTLFMTILVALFIPESLSPEKKAQIRLEQQQEAENRNQWTAIFVPFRQLGLLLPFKDPKTGKRKTRLFLLSLGYFCGTFGSAYIGQALLIYAIARFHFNVEDVSSFPSLYCFLYI
jgi:hypothetical protein